MFSLPMCKFSNGLNCLSHVIYAPQASTYQNIAKLLTHPSIFLTNSNLSVTVTLRNSGLKTLLTARER